jgi:hypothetical protein
MNQHNKIHVLYIILLCSVCVFMTAVVLSSYNRKPNPFFQNYSWLSYSKITRGFGAIMSSTYKDSSSVQPLSLERIFSPDHSWVAALPRDRVRTIITTGDVIPARSVNYQAVMRNDFSWPFVKTKALLSSADITLINLESPLIDHCPLTNEGMIFCGDTRHIKGLTEAGVDIANIANNHIGNYGPDGISQTMRLLTENGIGYSGTTKPVVKNIKGIQFAFLGYNDIGETPVGIAIADSDSIARDILQVKKDSDIVVVSFHWGIEYTSNPSQRQKDLAHWAIDAGADLVIGNHPHWVQPVELYKGKLIIYAHGNFIFDQMWSEETKYGIIGKYTFFDTQLVDAEFIPIYIQDYGQPDYPQGAQKTKIIELLRDNSYED